MKPAAGIERSFFPLHGSALIITLIFVVLLTGVVMAFLSKTMSERQLSQSSVISAKADNLAQSALQIITGDLKQEIVNGSTLVNGRCLPANNGAILSGRSGNPAPSGGVDPIPNLVRISSNAGDNLLPSTSTQPASNASASSSTDATASGRRIDIRRWNRHYLIPCANTSDTTPVASFTAPDWVYVKTNGPGVITAADPNVVGRYAYAIYDEGGLLDANVAGFPTSGATVAAAGGKANAATADLTAIGLNASQINTLVGWRNYATAQPTGNLGGGLTFDAFAVDRYFSSLAVNATGFLTVARATWNNSTDQAFVSRQMLINFWQQNNLPATALQYLGTFSREKNAPSWSPAYDASDLGGTAPAYKTNATQSGVTNPSLSTICFPSNATFTSYALDGTESTVSVSRGDSLVRQRFSLQRLKWLTPTGPNPSIPNCAEAIKYFFGMTWTTGANGYNCWVYTAPTGAAPATSIKTLSQVAVENREPDFFELLQAGILSGSVGLDAGPVGTTTAAGPSGDTQFWDQTTACQILQIGANIIDQYDSDGYPTEISAQFNLGAAPGSATALASIYGVENLPYIYAIYLAIFRYQSDFKKVGAWFIPQLWNPHQQPSAPVSPGPTQFRFNGIGNPSMRVYTSSPTNAAGPDPGNAAHSHDPLAGPTMNLASDPDGLQFSSALVASEPVLLDQSNATAVNTDNKIASAGMTFTVSTSSVSKTTQTHDYAGLFCGSVVDGCPYNTNTLLQYYDNAQLDPGISSFFLQYQDASGQWKTYTSLKKLSRSEHGFSWGDLFTGEGLSYAAMRTDPRTDRFSVGQNYQSYGGAPGMSNGFGIVNGQTLWPNAALTGYPLAKFPPNNPSHFFISGTGSVGGNINNNYVPWQLSANRNPPPLPGNNNAVSYYTDPDGVLRRADGAFALRSGSSGYSATTARDSIALVSGNSPSRPVILNRPFRNVCELGYAFRDMPWKHLDFFTPESADSGLLDIFTVDANDPAAGAVAGKVSLNTRQPLVLKSLLLGATLIDPAGAVAPGTTISGTEAGALATAIVSSASTTPFINRSEMVNRFTSGMEIDTRFASKPQINLSSNTDNRIKTHRESIVRALGDSTTTRTWNLLIDVIAQTGKYPAAATSLNQFVVDGERHYWLHLAIDRFTGEIVDRTLEPVYE